MTDDRQFREPPAALEALEAEGGERCESCGTERRPGDPILCRVCGDPVLGDGWTP